MEGKETEIARCLGYRHAFHDGNDDMLGDDINASYVTGESIGTNDDNASCTREDVGAADNGTQEVGNNVDMWHLRSLAIQRGGLMNSHCRKLGWIKLVGVDGLVFQGGKDEAGVTGDASSSMHGSNDYGDSNCTYENIQKQLELEMEPSRWHIQRERRRLRKSKKHKVRTLRSPSSAGVSSHASSTNCDLSSIGSHDERSGASTPLTANLNSRAGTPKSVTFDQGLGSPPPCASSIGLPSATPFTAFSTKRCLADSSSNSTTSSTASYRSAMTAITVDTTFDTSTLEATTTTVSNTTGKEAGDTTPSSLALTSPPRPTPQSQLQQPSPQFQLSLTPKSYLQYSQKYQERKHGNKLIHKTTQSSIAKSKKKDRRRQERKLLIQIATSAFYLFQSEQHHDSNVQLQYYPGMQDLIAILLLHLESPSLASLLLKQLFESHIWMFCHVREDDDDSCNESFVTCRDHISMNGSRCEQEMERGSSNGCGTVDDNQNWDHLSLSFFPLLQVLDEDFHSSLLQIDKGNSDGDAFLIDSLALMFGKVMRKWMSCWFCCHDTLPLEVVSRLVDFFLASHQSMPLYLSMAILCHPIHREKLILFSRRSPKSSRGTDTSTEKESTLHPPQSSCHDADISLSSMLENLFLNLPQELLEGRCEEHVDKFGSDASNGDAVDHDETDSDEMVVDFIEEAILTAISYMKQVPPQDIFVLVKEYRGGIFSSYLRHQEHEESASPSPWTNRSIAPTDYVMIQRIFADKKNGDANQFTLTRSVAHKYQIALDASGLPRNQIMIESRVHEYLRDFTRSRKMTPTKVATIGIAMCVGAQLLHSKRNPFDSKMILSEEMSPSLGLAVSLGIQSLHTPLNQHQQPQAIDGEDIANGEDIASVETALGSMLSLENDKADAFIEKPVGVSNSTSDSGDTSSLVSEDTQENLCEEVFNGDSPFLAVSLNTDNIPLDNKMLPVIAEGTAHSNSEVGNGNTDSKLLHHIPTNTEVSNVSQTLPDRDTSDTPYLFADDECFIAPEPAEENEPLLGQSMKKKCAKPPFMAHKVKKDTHKSSKLSAGIKKRAIRSLERLRDGYKAMVDDDDFFL